MRLLPAGSLQLALLLAVTWPTDAASPVHGLASLPDRPLVFGYLNDLRSTNAPGIDIPRLDFDAVDVVVQGFGEPRFDGTIGFSLGKLVVYRELLIAHAHAHRKAVVLSIGGGAPERLRNAFASVAANPLRRKTFARNLFQAVARWNYDGVDIDYEFPSTPREKDNFTALMRTIHAEFKGAHTNYIVMFGVSPGFYVDQMDWGRLGGCSDFAFYFGYDWKNPANGPLINPQAAQWLSGGTERIEASTRGAIQYVLAHGFPAGKLIFGVPFYSSTHDSWPVLRETWATNRVWFSNAIDVAAAEVPFAGRWWTTPEAVQRKMAGVLDPHSSVLTNHVVLRGIGFWEFGHQDVAKPDLTTAIKEWLAARANAAAVPAAVAK
ncbi:MAG: chitinase [Verrucomicrobiota bacterium]|jgi:hypothetical protein